MDNIPYGYCHCGCGEKARLSRENCSTRGLIKGEPLRFLYGHGTRKYHPHNLRDFCQTEDTGYETPCWTWRGPLDRNGYALTGSHGDSPAHVQTWRYLNGLVPYGHELDHLCRFRACINPSHLEVVTHVENVRRGKATKLTAEKVDEIRLLRQEQGISYRKLGKLFGVSNVQAFKICKGLAWK